MRALVTGGSGALGQAISEALAKAGHEVWVHANRRLAQAEAIAQRIVAHHVQWGIIAPLHRIADLGRELVDLVQRLGAGGEGLLQFTGGGGHLKWSRAASRTAPAISSCE